MYNQHTDSPAMARAMRYVLYARKSSESEDRQVQSIDDQTRIMRDMANSRGFTIVEEVTESHSAKDPGQRPGFERVVALIEQGHADAILCWHVNRLTRNPIDAGRLSWLLQTEKMRAIQTSDRTFPALGQRPVVLHRDRRRDAGHPDHEEERAARHREQAVQGVGPVPRPGRIPQ
jgi:hypothetical protein